MHEPLFGSQNPAKWHWSGGWQVTSDVGVQTPPMQRSPLVQRLLSSQNELSAFVGVEQKPVVVLHEPAVWQLSIVVQTTEVPGTQLPDWQVSPTVQALLSEQEVLLAFAGFEQPPVAGLQVPAT